MGYNQTVIEVHLWKKSFALMVEIKPHSHKKKTQKLVDFRKTIWVCMCKKVQSRQCVPCIPPPRPGDPY